MIDIGEVTSWLVDGLRVAFDADTVVVGAAVGDGIAPAVAGWTRVTPNDPVGVFVPYLVVTAGGAVTSLPGGTSLCDTVTVLMGAPYRVTAYDNDRVSADRLAARARTHLKALGPPTDLGDLQVRANAVFIDSLVGAVRTDQTDPPMFSAITNCRVNVARAAGGR